VKALTILSLILATAMLCLATDRKATSGPKGGKLLENSAPRAEFIIEPDNRVTVTFYDEGLKPVPVGGQIVSITAEPRTGKVNLELERRDGAFVSKQPLPKSGVFDEYQILVQIKATAEAKPEIFRIRFDLDVCSKCKLKEYACTCRH
jgi:hypothetical protein